MAVNIGDFNWEQKGLIDPHIFIKATMQVLFMSFTAETFWRCQFFTLIYALNFATTEPP